MGKDTLLNRIIIEKKGWIWLSVIAVGVLAIGFALLVDLKFIGREGINSINWLSELRYRLWQASEAVCNAIIAYSTVLATMVIFFYSVTENKRLGVPYRKLISYSVGPFTIPISFVFVLFLTMFMVLAQRIPLKYTTYICAGYIFVLQNCMITGILCSTSYSYGKRIIWKVEKRRYDGKIELEENDTIGYGYRTGFLEKALHSVEIVEDKSELLQEYLWIPFQEKRGKFPREALGKKICEEKEYLKKVYQFYFYNISSAFQNLSGEGKQIERNELYLSIGSFLKEWYKRQKEICGAERDKKSRILYHMVLSGVINGILYSGINDAGIFCDYALAECIPIVELRISQIYLCVLFKEIMSIFEIKEQKQPLLTNIKEEWEFINWTNTEEVEFFALFWEIWVDMFNTSQEGKLQHFEMAIQTMTGRSNRSLEILGVLLPTK